MTKTITATINGEPLTGRVSDMDALFFAGLLLPNFFEIKDQERGLKKAFTQFSQENAHSLATGAAQAEEMYESWGERLLIRLTTNLDIRSGFAQRVTEIFPTIDSTEIDFDRWHDKYGNVHDKSSIRLDIEPCMALVTSIIRVLEQPEVEPSQPVEKNTANAQSVNQTTRQAKLDQARALVQALEAQEA